MYRSLNLIKLHDTTLLDLLTQSQSISLGQKLWSSTHNHLGIIANQYAENLAFSPTSIEHNRKFILSSKLIYCWLLHVFIDACTGKPMLSFTYSNNSLEMKLYFPLNLGLGLTGCWISATQGQVSSSKFSSSWSRSMEFEVCASSLKSTASCLDPISKQQNNTWTLHAFYTATPPSR